MSPFKQRIAIAEACKIVSHDRWGPLYKTDKGFVRACPDYLNDLNAIAEAEATLTPHMNDQMTGWLLMLLGEENRASIHSFTVVRQASAAKRAEAFLRAMGKWEDSK